MHGERQPAGFPPARRYVSIDAVRAGDTVIVTFPVGNREVTETIAGNEYTFTIKGNTVLEVDPPGSNCPLYNRVYYREDTALRMEVERFVSDEQLPFYSKSTSHTTGIIPDKPGTKSEERRISIRFFGGPKHYHVVINGLSADERSGIFGTMHDMSGRVVSRLLSGPPVRTGRNSGTCHLDCSHCATLAPGVYAVTVGTRDRHIRKSFFITVSR